MPQYLQSYAYLHASAMLKDFFDCGAAQNHGRILILSVHLVL
jgi:hypothetical protein